MPDNAGLGLEYRAHAVQVQRNHWSIGWLRCVLRVLYASVLACAVRGIRGISENS